MHVRALALLVAVVTRVSAESLTAAGAAAQLEALRPTLVAAITAAVATNRYDTSYTTVWRDLEDDLSRALCAALTNHLAGFTADQCFAGVAGSEKNRPADLALVFGPDTIEISIKTARANQQPENDLGTIRELPARRRQFVASFALWARYDDRGATIQVDRVFFDRSYRFVGKSALLDGVKYRKKDGNLRPKPWAMFDSDTAFWATLEEFDAAVERSREFRARSLVQEHLRHMSEDDQRLLYEELRRKFTE